MAVKDIYGNLLKAKCPVDFFGLITTAEDLKREYRKYAKKIHPDVVPEKDKYIAGEAFSILNKLYNLGLSELEQGIYGIVDPVQIYKHMKPLFEITIKGELYQFYENVFEGEVAYIFKGTSSDDIVYLKVAIAPEDNDLITNEYNYGK